MFVLVFSRVGLRVSISLVLVLSHLFWRAYIAEIRFLGFFFSIRVSKSLQSIGKSCHTGPKCTIDYLDIEFSHWGLIVWSLPRLSRWRVAYRRASCTELFLLTRYRIYRHILCIELKELYSRQFLFLMLRFGLGIFSFLRFRSLWSWYLQFLSRIECFQALYLGERCLLSEYKRELPSVVS